MIDALVLLTLISALFGFMGLVEWVYDAHQRGMERVRKYNQRQETAK
jgi:hypothetical protein